MLNYPLPLRMFIYIVNVDDATTLNHIRECNVVYPSCTILHVSRAFVRETSARDKLHIWLNSQLHTYLHRSVFSFETF